MTWTTLDRKLRAINATHSSGLWLTWTTPVCELEALDAMNSSRFITSIAWSSRTIVVHVNQSPELCVIWATLNRELRLWILWIIQLCGWNEQLGILWAWSSRCYKQIRVVDDMNDSWLWAYGSKFYEQLRYVHNMNDFKSWAQGLKWNEELRFVIDMNDFGSWPQHFKCYEQLKVVDDMSYSGSLAQSFGCHEQLKVEDDMNDLGSLELGPLDGMNNLGVWMI